MPKFSDYSDAGALQNTDLFGVSRSPFTSGTFFNTNLLSVASYLSLYFFNASTFSASGTPLQLENPLPAVISIVLTSASQVSLPAMNAQVPPTKGRSYLIYNGGNPSTDSPFEITAQDTTTVVLPRLEIGETALLSVLDDSTANGTWLAEVIPDYYIETRIINGGNIGTTIAIDLVLGNVLETSTAAAFTASSIGTNGIVLGLNWWFKNNSSGNLTFTPNSPNLIDGNASLTLLPNQSAQIVCDGAKFSTISLSQDYNLGTMATQNANAVAITGGNINGTVIGGSTPAAGSFTTLQATSGIDSTAIGATTASTGEFTTLVATSGINSTVIGGSTPAAGTFTTLAATGGLDTTVIGANTAENGTFLNIAGSQITFSGSNESALSIYEFGSYTSTFTWGSATSGTITINFWRIGRSVTVFVPTFTITNSSTQTGQQCLANTNAPARLQPSAAIVINTTIQNPTGTVVASRNVILSTGQIAYQGPLAALITGTGNLSLDQCTFNYFV